MKPNLLTSGAFVTIEPGRVVVGWGPFQETPHRLPGQNAFYFPDFFLEDSVPWKVPLFWEELSVEEFLKLLPRHIAAAPKIAWKGLSQSSFRHSFADLMQRLRSGALSKGVPVLFEEGELFSKESEFLPWLLTRDLSEEGALYPYGFWKNGKSVVGATPELLFHRTGKREIKTMALAGTSPQENGAELLETPKERKEHRLVVETLEGLLQPLGKLHVGQTRMVSYRHLHHLKTEMRVYLEDLMEFERVVQLLHPTPALGAIPKDAGMRWIREQEHLSPRGRFGAPFGFEWSDGRASCLVAIRHIEWEGKRLKLGAGCGVIAESTFDREWEELCLKRDSVKRMFGL